MEDIVVIEHCKDCNKHNWCTNHDEKKYLDICEKTKSQIESECPEVTVITNQEHPSILPILSQKTDRTPFAKLSFPKTGSFEVYFRGKIIFSKLKHGIWPHPAMVAKSIRDILDGVVEVKTTPQTTGFKEFQSKPEVPKRSKPGTSDKKETVQKLSASPSPAGKTNSSPEPRQKEEKKIEVKVEEKKVEVKKVEEKEKEVKKVEAKAVEDAGKKEGVKKVEEAKTAEIHQERVNLPNQEVKHEEPVKVSEAKLEVSKESEKTAQHEPQKHEEPVKHEEISKHAEVKHHEHVDVEHKHEVLQKSEELKHEEPPKPKEFKHEDPPKPEEPKHEDHPKPEEPKHEEHPKPEEHKPEELPKPKEHQQEAPPRPEEPKHEDQSKPEEPKHEDHSKPEENKHEDHSKPEEHKHEEHRHEEKPGEISTPLEKNEENPPAMDAESEHYEDDIDMQESNNEPPYHVTESFKVELAVGEGKNSKIPLKNTKDSSQVFNIQVKNDSLIRIVQTEYVVDPGVPQKLKLEILPQSHQGEKKGFIIVESEKEVVACLEIVVDVN